MEYQQILDEQQMAASVLQEEQKRIIDAGRTLSPEVNTVEQATDVIRSALADLQLIRREQSALGDIILEIQRAPDEDPLPADMRQNLEQLQEERNTAQEDLEIAREQLAQVKAQADAIGVLDDVRGQLSACKAQIRHWRSSMQQQSMPVKSLPRKMRCSNRRFHQISSAVHNPICHF